MVDFQEQIKSLSKRVASIKDNIMTEEATKTSLVMPFFQLLGYDIFNPAEFTPEFIADVGIKKGEKVDYAIMNEGFPVILIEAKSVNEVLEKHDSQLFRYFGTTTAKFAILTNGVIYRFYTDLEEKNKMDTSPFFEFNLLDLRDSSIQELGKFRKDSFDLDKIFNTASELKYLNKIKTFLNDQWEIPSDEFVKFLVGQIYDGIKTKNTIEKFEPIVKKGFKQFINDLVNDKLNAALKSTAEEDRREIAASIDAEIEVEKSIEPLVVTTEEEIQEYAILKAILTDILDSDRVYYRDNQSYFNVLLDDNIRKWIVRLYLETSKKYIEFNDEGKERVPIDRVTDILKHSERIKKIAKMFM
ncbi:type I restriction endonuclease [Siminovitchia fortis]|uniref:Endonuclease n=1 Tax=Siminovitchia fortis TaxID=254758 RepID=A0A443IJ31_9BACI|nr:type I restriction endonuclease [Siminovitchia fortis]RWR04177.1 endonuclease [Siminovitchia fortis]WHY80556.1 type I restriction endonuclease [Siminovitchia fortis]